MKKSNVPAADTINKLIMLSEDFLFKIRDSHYKTHTINSGLSRYGEFLRQQIHRGASSERKIFIGSMPPGAGSIYQSVSTFDYTLSLIYDDAKLPNDVFCTELVFLFEYWEHSIRRKIKILTGKQVQSDVFGDLRTLRNSIVHGNGRLERNLRLLNSVLPLTKDEKVIIRGGQFDDILRMLFAEMKKISIELAGASPMLTFDSISEF